MVVAGTLAYQCNGDYDFMQQLMPNTSEIKTKTFMLLFAC